MFTFTTRTVALLGATALTASAAAGCGSTDHAAHSSSPEVTTTSHPSAAAVDRAFVAQMIPHHEMAVEMAGYAPARSTRTAIEALGGRITAGQTAEITQMRAAAKRLGARVAEMPSHEDGGPGHAMHDDRATASAATTLGIPADRMGMAMDTTSLATADPFDRAFIDEMIPHHQGAILMARAEIDRGTDPELRRIATAIVAAQTREIRQMNAWRERWYGAASPAGGVPGA